MARGTDKEDAFYFPEEQLYAIAGISGKNLIVTGSKPYPIFDEDWQLPVSFHIMDDAGQRRLCLRDECAHLDGEAWTIVKESDLSPEQCRMAGLPTEDATIAELREHLSQVEKRLERQQDRDTKVFDELSERIEALEARVPVDKKTEPEWPQAGDKFWVLDVTGEPFWSVWPGGSTVSGARSFLGIYETREQAERRAKQVRIVIEELNSGRSVRIRDGEDAIVP